MTVSSQPAVNPAVGPAGATAPRPVRALPPLTRVDLGEVPYEQAMADMDQWVRERREQRAPDRLFLLGHPPVVTFGYKTSPEHLASLLPGVAVVPTDRGGQATYHGPGQLVGYLVAGLRERGPRDIVRWLEQGLVDALADLGVSAVRRDTPRGETSLVGVWTPDHRKVASIGMRVRGSITSHGFALNVDPDMSVFDTFTVCGLRDVTTTSVRLLAEEQGIAVPSPAQVRDAVAGRLGAVAA